MFLGNSFPFGLICFILGSQQVVGHWNHPELQYIGCWNPFRLLDLSGGSFLSIGNVTSLQRCVNECDISDHHLLIRGRFCTCYPSEHFHTSRLVDSYCDIPCPDSIEDVCGGNLGASVYCLLENDHCRMSDVDKEDPFYLLDDAAQECLYNGCGVPADPPLTYSEFMTQLNPQDCIAMCIHMEYSYAFLGWKDHSTHLLGSYCSCSNFPPGETVYDCGGDCLDENGYVIGSPCGNPNTDEPSWAVFCTSVVAENHSCQRFNHDMDFGNLDSICPRTTKTEILTRSISTPLCQENTRLIKNLDSTNGFTLNCNVTCGTIGCYFDDRCYFISDDFPEDCTGNTDSYDLQEEVNKVCARYANGHLVSVESLAEEQHLQRIFNTGNSNVGLLYMMTSGRANDSSTGFYWNIPRGNVVNDSIVNDVVQCTNESDEYPHYLVLRHNSQTHRFDQWCWTSTNLPLMMFICEYDDPNDMATTDSATTDPSFSTSTSTKPLLSTATTTDPSFSTSTSIKPLLSTATTTDPSFSTSTSIKPRLTTSTTTDPSFFTSTSTKPLLSTSTTTDSSFSTSTTTDSSFYIPTSTIPTTNAFCCHGYDSYGRPWEGTVGENVTKKCPGHSEGFSTWFCQDTGGGCHFQGDQPDFSNCQSQWISDVESAIADHENASSILETIEHETSTNIYFGHEVDKILDALQKTLILQNEQLTDTAGNNLQTQLNSNQVAGSIVNNLLSNLTVWDHLNEAARSSTAIHLLNTSHEMSFWLADGAQKANLSLHCETHRENIVFSSVFWQENNPFYVNCQIDHHFNSTHQPFLLRFPIEDSNGTYLVLPESILISDHPHNGAGVLIHPDLVDQLFRAVQSIDGKRINTPIVSYSIQNGNSSSILDDGEVTIVYRHALKAKNPPVKIIRRWLSKGEVPSPVIGSATCAFLLRESTANYSSKETNWTWSSDHCRLIRTDRKETECRCNQVTSFSSLMHFHEYVGKSDTLKAVSISCSALSITGLITTIILLAILRTIKNDRTAITQNLCGSLAVAHVLFVTTLEKHVFWLDDMTCAILGLVLHYSLLTAFMWMAVEGIRLCRILVVVFDTGQNHFSTYCILAYGIPVFIVSITVTVAVLTHNGGLVAAYSGDEMCWLVDSYTWSFSGPVIVIILMNLVLILFALFTSWKQKANSDKPLFEKIRNSLSMSLSLFFLLGVSWLSGFFLLAESDVFVYIFAISNGLQGVMIFLFRCVFNKQLRKAVKDKFKRHLQNADVNRHAANSQRNKMKTSKTTSNWNSLIGKLNVKSATSSPGSFSSTRLTDASFSSSKSFHRNDLIQLGQRLRVPTVSDCGTRHSDSSRSSGSVENEPFYYPASMMEEYLLHEQKSNIATRTAVRNKYVDENPENIY